MNDDAICKCIWKGRKRRRFDTGKLKISGSISGENIIELCNEQQTQFKLLGDLSIRVLKVGDEHTGI